MVVETMLKHHFPKQALVRVKRRADRSALGSLVQNATKVRNPPNVYKVKAETFQQRLRIQSAKSAYWEAWRVFCILCMTDLAHASPTKEHDDDDDFQGTTGRAA